MDNVWVSQSPCSQSTLDVGYMPKILDRIEPEEMLIMCPLWDFAGSCGVQARTNGGPCQDHSNSQFGGPEESQIVSHSVIE